MAGKLVPCKACGQEIAKGVKKCPNCGKDQRNFFMRHKIITFILAVVVIIIIANIGGGGGSEATSKTSSSSKAETEKTYNIGDTVKTEKTEVTVTKVEKRDSVGNEFLNKKASDGGILVAVQYTVKNVSKKPISSFSIPTVKLVDSTDTSYDADIDASSNYAAETKIDDSKILSDLNPNIKVTNVEVFEVDKDAYSKGTWKLKFSNDVIVKIK
ncbi:YxkC [Bacillus mojavensis]|uniref:YxkC n=2 Tax=Bacillaceae TaxID=186817 RepID=A0ABX6M278_BACMO|nr:YxkC [Bacillus mojavensis]